MDAAEHDFVGDAVHVVYVVCIIEVWGRNVVDGGLGTFLGVGGSVNVPSPWKSLNSVGFVYS